MTLSRFTGRSSIAFVAKPAARSGSPTLGAMASCQTFLRFARKGAIGKGDGHYQVAAVGVAAGRIIKLLGLTLFGPRSHN